MLVSSSASSTPSMGSSAADSSVVVVEVPSANNKRQAQAQQQQQQQQQQQHFIMADLHGREEILSSNEYSSLDPLEPNYVSGSSISESQVHSHDDAALLAEWQAKYDRLFEAHRKLQKTNNSLEDKLLRIVDKFESDKNQMTRDLASQTQKLVQAKLTIQQLHDQNGDLQNDLNLSLTLLQNRPSSYMAQRVDSLPQDMQLRVRSYLAERQQEKKLSREKTEGKRIRVPIMEEVADVGEDEKVSAAILAKVLEERSKERRKEHKFCIDVGTQTHGWHFPDNKLFPAGHASSAQSGPTTGTSSSTGSSSNGTNTSTSPSSSVGELLPGAKAPATTAGSNGARQKSVSASPVPKAPSSKSGSTPEVIQILRSISLDHAPDPVSKAPITSESHSILLASVIRSPPASVIQEQQQQQKGPLKSMSFSTALDTVSEGDKNLSSLPLPLIATSPPLLAERRSARLARSQTFSKMQTDL